MKKNNVRVNINCAIISLAITLFVPTISNAMRYTKKESRTINNPNSLISYPNNTQSKKNKIEEVKIPISFKIDKTNFGNKYNQNSKGLGFNICRNEDTVRTASKNTNRTIYNKNFLKNLNEINYNNRIKTKVIHKKKSASIPKYEYNEIKSGISPVTTQIDCFEENTNKTPNNSIVSSKPNSKSIMNSNNKAQKINIPKIPNYELIDDNKYYDENNIINYCTVYDKNGYKNNEKIIYKKPNNKNSKINLLKKFNFSNNENNYNRSNYNINNYMKIKPNNQNNKNKEENIQYIESKSKKKPINEAKTFNKKYSPQANISYNKRQHKKNKRRSRRQTFQTEELLKTLKNVIQQFGKLISFYTEDEVEKYENSYLEENYDKITTKIKIHNGIVTYVEEKQKYDN